MVTTEIWHDLIETERQLRQAAEDLARRWREAFFSVAAIAATTDYETRLRAGMLPGSPEDAARWLMSSLQTGWRLATPGDGRIQQEVERLRRENARLVAEVEQLRAQAHAPRPSGRPAEPPKAPSRPALASVPVPPPPPPQGTAAAERAGAETAEEARLRANGNGAPLHPASLGETHPAPPLDVSELQRFLASVKPPPQFQAEFFTKDGLLVATIGYTGVSSRPRLAKTLAAALGVSSKAGSLTRCFERCERLGLTRLYKEPGAPFSLLSLTEKGKEVFRQMFGYDPAPSEAEVLLRSHPNNITHAVYCAWAREFAEFAGYEVEIPPRAGAQGFAPDLVFRADGRAFGVEVERALGASAGRVAKWQNAKAAQGFAAVIADGMETAERLAEEIASAGVDFRITDFSYLVANQPRTRDFWRISREDHG